MLKINFASLRDSAFFLGLQQWLSKINSKFEVDTSELDVSPLQLQGPRSQDALSEILGEDIRKTEILLVEKSKFERHGINIRTGWSSELGYEITCRIVPVAMSKTIIRRSRNLGSSQVITSTIV